MEPKYKRILIKLSGEALAGEKGVGIDLTTVQTIAKEIAEVHSSGVEIALVIGGGNLWRGEPAAAAGMDRVLTSRLHWYVRYSDECPCNG